MTEAVATKNQIVDVEPEMLAAWLAEADTVLVDVREDFEHAAERIESAHHIPLKRVDPQALRQAHPEKRIVFQCRTGVRSAKAARQFLDSGETQAYHLAGGLRAWKESGLPTERSAGAPPIDVMRQVQITAGSLVLLGIVLAALISPWFMALSAFIGARPRLRRFDRLVRHGPPARPDALEQGRMSLEMKDRCERCAAPLAPDADARICSYECTFCVTCAEDLVRCPNCNGELVPRPRPQLRMTGQSTS